MEKTIIKHYTVYIHFKGNQFTCILVGGFVTPAVAGWPADQFALQAPLLIAAGAAISEVLIVFFLGETAPALLKKKILLNNKPVAIQQTKKSLI